MRPQNSKLGEPPPIQASAELKALLRPASAAQAIQVGTGTLLSRLLDPSQNEIVDLIRRSGLDVEELRIRAAQGDAVPAVATPEFSPAVERAWNRAFWCASIRDADELSPLDFLLGLLPGPPLQREVERYGGNPADAAREILSQYDLKPLHDNLVTTLNLPSRPFRPPGMGLAPLAWGFACAVVVSGSVAFSRGVPKAAVPFLAAGMVVALLYLTYPKVPKRRPLLRKAWFQGFFTGLLCGFVLSLPVFSLVYSYFHSAVPTTRH